MSEAGEIDRFEACVERFNREGARAWREFSTPDVVMVTADGFPGGGRFEGREAITAFSEDFEAAWEEVRYEVADARMVGGAVLHRARWVARGRESQVPVTLDFFGVARMDGEKIASMKLFWDEPEAVEHARSGAAP